MAPEKSPAFQFYPRDFLTDDKVARMTYTERGVYITLLSHLWLHPTLAADESELAGFLKMPLPRFRKLWAGPLGRCFRTGDDGRLIQKRLEEERQKQENYRRRQSDAAAVRWEKVGNAAAVPAQCPRVEDEEEKGKALVIPERGRGGKPDGRSKRPIYTSDRFVVFEWQLDALERTLGPHVAGFDLHAFFDDLTQKSRNQGLVIPQSDRDAFWRWLQAQVEAEARRRGLPMAAVDQAPVTSKRINALTAGGDAFLKRSQG